MRLRRVASLLHSRHRNPLRLQRNVGQWFRTKASRSRGSRGIGKLNGGFATRGHCTTFKHNR
jgi:hypothetical protein